MDGVDLSDFPDLCDSFVASADYNGEPMTEEQIDELNDNYDYSGFIHEQAHESLY